MARSRSASRSRSRSRSRSQSSVGYTSQASSPKKQSVKKSGVKANSTPAKGKTARTRSKQTVKRDKHDKHGKHDVSFSLTGHSRAPSTAVDDLVNINYDPNDDDLDGDNRLDGEVDVQSRSHNTRSTKNKTDTGAKPKTGKMTTLVKTPTKQK